MTTPTRFEHDLPRLLDELYVTGTPDYRDDLVRRIAATSQRPAWTIRERWFPMDVATRAVPTARMPWRQLGVLALIALLLAIAVISIVGASQRLPEPYGVAANGPLVYVDDGDVYLREELDGPARVIVGGPDEEVWAMYSPRGDKLLVIRLEDGFETLWAGRPDGSELIPIGGPYSAGHWVEFSPDGSLVAIQYEKAGVPKIELVMTDGSGSRPITEMTAETPTFRPPDGRQILFRGMDQETGDWGFYLLDVVAGGEPVRLAIDGADLEGGGYDLLSPAWSPTGDQLAYHSLVQLPESRGATNGFRISVASIDDTGKIQAPRPLEMDPTADDEMGPVFSQDGRSLYYQQRFGLLGQTDYTDSAWMVSLDDASARPLGVETSNGDGFFISIAPDDTEVLVHLNKEAQDWRFERASGSVHRTDLESDSGAAWRREAP